MNRYLIFYNDKKRKKHYQKKKALEEVSIGEIIVYQKHVKKKTHYKHGVLEIYSVHADTLIV